jgi:predicted Na+-dependent transporter
VTDGPSGSRLAQLASSYRELVLVLVAAAVGLAAHRPLRFIGGHHGIDALLIVLVFSSAVTVSPDAFDLLRAAWKRVLVGLLSCAAVLPALAWLAARVVSAGSLRNGVLAIGLAPCEIASVAATGMAGGEPIIAAAVLVGSTALSVALAGPILAVEAGHAGVHPGGVLVSLLIVVALPLAVGVTVRARWPVVERYDDRADNIGVAALIGLVALVAAQAELGRAYLGVLLAVAIFLVGSGALGALLGRRATRGVAIPLLLTTSMRDFAIAAGLASAAFGPRAAAPLGLYGVVVLAWGTGVGGRLRQAVA